MKFAFVLVVVVVRELERGRRIITKTVTVEDKYEDLSGHTTGSLMTFDFGK